MRILSVLFVLVLVGCGGHDRPATVTIHGTTEGYGSVGAHAVQYGDTVYSIASRYQVRFEDLAAVNDLGAPYALDVGQRLKLPPPKTYRVRRGDTLFLISYMFEVDMDAVAQANGIDDPLRLQAGRVLTLPSVAEQRRFERADDARDDVIQPPSRRVVVQDNARGDKGARLPDSAQAVDGVVKPGRKPDVNVASRPVSKPKANIKTKRVSKLKVNTPKRASSKFLQPVRGRVLSGYGPKKDGLYNDGINIAAARGTAVAAAENGVVVYAGNGLKGSGNLILVRHEDRWMTAYAHLDRIDVANGAIVKRGAKIGSVGSTGAVKSPQLHFEVRRGTKALNPKPYLE